LRGKKKKNFLRWKEIKEFFDIFDIKRERKEARRVKKFNNNTTLILPMILFCMGIE